MKNKIYNKTNIKNKKLYQNSFFIFIIPKIKRTNEFLK